MATLFDTFPLLSNERLHIRMMDASDVSALSEISNNENVYRYIAPFLYKKSEKALLTAINNFSGRDFDKKKWIIAGIYLAEAPNKLIGLAEMFDYKKSLNTITVGYRINERHWKKGIATSAVGLMLQYLAREMGIHTIQAFTMPENIYSGKVLLKNGFVKQDYTVQQTNWGGQALVDLEVYIYRNDPILKSDGVTIEELAEFFYDSENPHQLDSQLLEE